jgi:hypothetical protein
LGSGAFPFPAPDGHPGNPLVAWPGPVAGGVTAARQVLALVVGVRIPARQHDGSRSTISTRSREEIPTPSLKSLPIGADNPSELCPVGRVRRRQRVSPTGRHGVLWEGPGQGERGKCRASQRFWGMWMDSRPGRPVPHRNPQRRLCPSRPNIGSVSGGSHGWEARGRPAGRGERGTS